MNRTIRYLRVALLSALVLAMLGGCKKKSKQTPAPAPGPSPQKLAESVSGLLPGGAALYLFVDLRWAQNALTTGWTDFIVGAKIDLKKALSEISAVCKQAYGIDCTRARSVAGFLSFKTRSGAAILFGDLGGTLNIKKVKTTTIAGRKAFQIERKLFVTQVGRDQLWLGDRTGLTQLAEVQQKKRESLARAPGAASIRKLLASLPKPRRGLAIVNLTKLPLPALFKLDLAAITLDTHHRLQFTLTGPTATLKKLKGLAAAQLKRVRAMLVKSEAASRENKKLFLGLLTALSTAHLDTVLQAANMKIKDNTMSLALDFRALHGFVPLMGLGAAVSVPAFIRYMRKAKTSEALRAINKIAKGAFVYASKSRPDASGKPQNCQFPRSVEWTPKGSPCKHPAGKFPAGSSKWNHETWWNVLFKMSGEHYYQYRVVRKGVGNNSTLTIEARGDLDCDGIFSLFRQTLILKTDPKNQTLNCRVTWNKGHRIHIENETE